MSPGHLHTLDVPSSETDLMTDSMIGVLHGIFGAGRNWLSLMKQVLEQKPEWSARLYDLRGHGRSDHFPEPQTVASAARDFIETNDHPKVVMGHSFGGKVALSYLQQVTIKPVQVWVIDSSPASADPSGDAWAMIKRVQHLPTTFESRAQAVTELQNEGLTPGVAQWMAMNLHREPGRKLTWRFRLEDIEAMLLDFFACEFWDLIENLPEAVTVHFVKATESKVMRDEVAQRVEKLCTQTEQVKLHYLEGGHWLHVENPEGLNRLLSQYLPV